jgi:hypothetical protein
MGFSQAPGDRARPLQCNLEVLAHLIYLARRCKSEQQQRYIELAENVIEEMKCHPKLWE